MRTNESEFVDADGPSSRFSSKRRKAAAVLLERANAHIHQILRRADPSIFICPHGHSEPVPLPDIVSAINHAGHWPPHLIHSRRLPRILIHVRQTTALMAIHLTDSSPREIARALGNLDHATITAGANAARKRLGNGEDDAIGLFGAALVTLLQRHPRAVSRLDDELRQAARDVIGRHQLRQASGSRM
jgi:hypothetical protein